MMLDTSTCTRLGRGSNLASFAGSIRALTVLSPGEGPFDHSDSMGSIRMPNLSSPYVSGEIVEEEFEREMEQLMNEDDPK